MLLHLTIHKGLPAEWYPFIIYLFSCFEYCAVRVGKPGYPGLDAMVQVNQKSEKQYSHSDDQGELSGKPAVMIIILTKPLPM